MRKYLGAVALAAVALSAVLIGTASAAKPAPTAANGCPNGGSYLADPKVGAEVTASGNTFTYKFSSWVDQNPVNGVPGLVGYCVSTDKAPASFSNVYDSWKTSKAGSTFSFTRPNGEKTNIPLDGTQDITVGKATFSSTPGTQTILLHVSDAGTCQSLYGGDATTCFVLPGPRPGPVCDQGDSSVAYNAMSFDVVNCLNPALGFEAQSVNEFGDEVGLAGTARTLDSLKVDFQSFACQSGHWELAASCSSVAGATFTHPITANIYEVGPGGTVGALLATTTQTQTIPYRPSADPTCPANSGPAPAGAAWFNPLAPGGGACQNSIGTVLTFDNWAYQGTFTGTLPDTVIWTVAFNTETSGYTPTGVDGPYDSLNVGAKTYPNAPYAGTDSDVNTAFVSVGNSALASDSGWANNRPLGEIIVTP